MLMGWKEFLKPTLRKILVFLSIPTSYFILIILFGRIDFLLNSITILYSILLLPIFVFWVILNEVGIETFPDVATGSFIEIFGELSLFLFAIFWVYFLSCSLVLIYDKFKPTDKQPPPK